MKIGIDGVEVPEIGLQCNCSSCKDNMIAEIFFYDKPIFIDGYIVELVIWKLPKATEDRQHRLRYRLFYRQYSLRVVGYDKDSFKCDHKHIYEVEVAYKL